VSESEKFEKQGRAHAGLKEARANAATLHASLLRYSQRLDETNAYLKQFLSDPLDEGGYVSAADHVKANYRNLTSSSFESDVDGLVMELKRARDLKEQIEKF
jgi:hypothetical protein